jgi:hypothetical protein
VVIEQYTRQKDRECQLRFHEADKMIKDAKELDKQIRKFVDEQKAEALAEINAMHVEKDNAIERYQQAEFEVRVRKDQLKEVRSKNEDVEMKLNRERDRHKEELKEKSDIIRGLKDQLKDLKLKKKQD